MHGGGGDVLVCFIHFMMSLMGPSLMSSIASFGDSFEAQELMMLLSISFISLRLPVVLLLRVSWFPSEALGTCTCLGIVFKLSILVLEL